MTTYILAGGADRVDDLYAQKLEVEARAKLRGQIRLLSCFFAEPERVWQAKHDDRQPWFKKVFGKDAHIRLARPDIFARQVEWAHIIYLHGGEDKALSYWLNQIADLAKLWAGKIIIGSSAGADYLSNRYWTCDAREVQAGSGITPLNVITHFNSPTYGKNDPRGPIDWTGARQELQQAIGTHEHITLLPEGQFVILEQCTSPR